ncbi:hypothetical protein H2248_003246 [Termitomyces sp. 'cryptogamus']|nr:hypothetical protein H2248_003246 [Termitomyces sp. 'cryptogamus']
MRIGRGAFDAGLSIETLLQEIVIKHTRCYVTAALKLYGSNSTIILATCSWLLSSNYILAPEWLCKVCLSSSTNETSRNVSRPSVPADVLVMPCLIEMTKEDMQDDYQRFPTFWPHAISR